MRHDFQASLTCSRLSSKSTITRPACVLERLLDERPPSTPPAPPGRNRYGIGHRSTPLTTKGAPVWAPFLSNRLCCGAIASHGRAGTGPAPTEGRRMSFMQSPPAKQRPPLELAEKRTTNSRRVKSGAGSLVDTAKMKTSACRQVLTAKRRRRRLT